MTCLEAVERDVAPGHALEGSPLDRCAKTSQLPTPDEIAAVCAEIRSGWTPADWRRATTYRPMRWEVPTAAVAKTTRRKHKSATDVALAD